MGSTALKAPRLEATRALTLLAPRPMGAVLSWLERSLLLVTSVALLV
ncbi:MAG: hypothetical protein IPL70_14450 [Uliginosibacterium sp.]|nr:hypothetical protein [Uliginosibacterium sp.]